MSNLYHIRKRLRPRRGTNIYLDRSPRIPVTFCGADVTAYDITHDDCPSADFDSTMGRQCCRACLDARGA